jgi:hypothetical protein
VSDTKPTVAIDIDGVIYNIIDHIIDKFLPNLPKGYQPTKWECCDELGISKETFFNHYTFCWYEASYYPAIGIQYLNNDIFDLIDKLRCNGFRISIITKRPQRDMGNTIHFLKNYGIHYDSFTNIIDKQDKTKENFDVLIDDYYGNMPTNIHDNKRGLLLNKAWNKDYIIPRDLRENGKISRVDNFNEALYLILSYYPKTESKPVIV